MQASCRFHLDMLISAVDRRSTAVREMWRQVSAERFLESNPKLKINAETVPGVAPPSAKIEFVDGSEVNNRVFKRCPFCNIILNSPLDTFTLRLISRETHTTAKKCLTMFSLKHSNLTLNLSWKGKTSRN